jgi:hypothetical protein
LTFDIQAVDGSGQLSRQGEIDRVIADRTDSSMPHHTRSMRTDQPAAVAWPARHAPSDMPLNPPDTGASVTSDPSMTPQTGDVK